MVFLGSHRPNGWHEFSNAAGYADSYMGEGTPLAYFFRARQSLVMNLLCSPRGSVVLDLGCGPGLYARPCTERGFRYHGLDISDDMIGEGRRRYGCLEGVEFSVADARHLPLTSNSVDVVLCLGMLEYVTKEEEAAYLDEFKRVLKEDGVIVFSFLNRTSLYWSFASFVSPFLRFFLKNAQSLIYKSKFLALGDCLGESVPARKFARSERSKRLGDLGLSVLGSHYFAASIVPPPFANRLPHMSVFASTRLEPLLRKRRLFSWLGMGFIMVARKSPAQ